MVKATKILRKWRKKEFERLENLLENAKQKKGSIVLVEGKTGSGKSELISEFLKSDHVTDNVLVVKTACIESRSPTDPFYPFCDLFKQIHSEERRRRLSKRILDHLLDLVPPLIENLPFAGEALADEAKKAEAYFRNDLVLERKDTSQWRLLSKCKDYLQGVSKRWPLILVIDDLHWVDDSSANLLRYLSKRIADSPILIIGIYCEEGLKGRVEPPPLDRMKGCPISEITLKHLEKQDVRDYISEVLPNCRFQEKLTDFLWEKTGGNPLFVTEMIKQLKNTQEKKGKKQLSMEEIENMRTPETVESLIKYRIDTLDEIDRKLCDFASVEGKEFTSDILSKLLSIDRVELSRRLRIFGEIYQIVKETERKSMDFGSYEFLNSLFHRGFYDCLGTEERILLHRRIGEILEAECKGDNEKRDRALTLVHHFNRGRMPEKALDYLRIAADKIEETKSFAEELSLYKSVDQIIENRKPEEKAGIWIKMGEICRILGQMERSLYFLEKSLRVSEETNDKLMKASILTKRGITLFHLGRFTKSIGDLEEAKQIYESRRRRKNVDKETYGICLEWLGINYRNCGKMKDAFRLHQDALRIARKVKSRRLEAHAHANLGAIHLWEKKYFKVMEYWEKSLKISESINDLPWVAHYTVDVGYMYLLYRNYKQAKEYLEKGVEIAQKYDFEETLARGLMNLGSYWFVKEDFDKGKEYYDEALEIAERQNIPRLVWRLQHNIGNIYRKQKNYEKAEEEYMRSIRYLEEEARKLESENEEGFKEGFLKHRLDPYSSMILLRVEMKKEIESDEFADISGYKLLSDFLDKLNRDGNIDKIEKEEGNFFRGYYVVTE